MRQHQQRFGTVLLAALAVVVAARETSAQGPPGAVAVRYTEARAHSIRATVRLAGTIEPVIDSVIASDVAGIVVERAVDEGDRVAKGDVLVKLRQRRLRLQLDAARANLAEAEARLARAERVLTRARELFRKEVASTSDLDDASSEHAAWLGRATSLKAEIARLEDELSRSVLRAPFAGVVTRRYADVGEWLEVGGSVVELAAVDVLQVRVAAPERYFAGLASGQAATIRVGSLPELDLEGMVSAVVPRADERTRTFPVLVRIANPDGKLGAGMLVDVGLGLGEARDVTIVPKDALIARGPQRFVLTIGDDDMAQMLPVQPGGAVGDWVEVGGPVSPGTKVVTRGNERLFPGQQVAGEPLEYPSAMKLVDASIRYPVTTTVGVILLVLFGSLALMRIPIQLTPTVEDPQITIQTFWAGASPAEIEREIVDEQEEQLKSLEGLVEMESESSDSQAQVILTFRTGVDLDAVLLRVSNRLEQVPEYPADADKPILLTADPNFGAIAWFGLHPSGETPFAGDITTLYDFIEDRIKPELERVPGVANSMHFGGREREVQVIVDPEKLAVRGLTMNQVAMAIERENRSFSAGDFSEGKRRYVVRTVGEYERVEDIEEIVVAVVGGSPVYVRDFAEARLDHQKAVALAFMEGEPIIAMNAIRESGANVLETMAELHVTVDRLNAEVLASEGLAMTQVYDETEYIRNSISLVKTNLFVGGFLAIAVLLLFLRSGTSTLVIAVAIPISVVGTFLMMNWFDRTLNVISLAGMAFAVGMVVDNSIVVLENIYRHRQMGKDRKVAAYEGAREVWGAVLASTLTTIAVFVPVVFIQEEAGQLFRDIAIAISCAVGLSLIVAMTVIPSMSARLLSSAADSQRSGGLRQLFGLVPLAARFSEAVASAVHWLTASVTRRLATVVLFTGVAVGTSIALMPKAEYLPTGSNNFLFGIVLPPPGYSLDEVTSIQDFYVRDLGHLWQGDSAELPGGGIRDFFYVSLNNMAFMGASSNDGQRVKELMGPFAATSGKIPGTYAFMMPSSIFQRGIGAGRAIDIELTGPEIEGLVGIGGQMFGQLMQVLPGSQSRPIPSLDLGNPELRVRPDRRRAAELGISNRDLGLVVSALVDGIKVSDYKHEGREIDIRLMAGRDGEHRTHLIEQMPIATPDGRVVTLGAVADVTEVTGPATIRHVERERSITIQVSPAETVPLQEAMETIEAEILTPLRESGQLGGEYRAKLSGTADKLTQTGTALFWNFILAVVITYLLMAALFESFLYPFVILFSVPLAAMGGFLGLFVVNKLLGYQPLDILTMLGFIILVGTVVNNAILIVHQSLNHMRDEGMASRDAIRESTRTRVRPILMSVATSVFGMLPLVLFPGAGSELYRGLGSVVVGGLSLSALFTLFLVPALFSLVLDARDAVARRVSFLHQTAEHGEA